MAQEQQGEQAAPRVRVLEEGRLEEWFDFLALCFAQKGTPRAYFRNHFVFDPWRGASVVLHTQAGGHDGQLTSTLRLFDRRMFLGGDVVGVAGVGEVATHPDHRRRGLAAAVLREAGARVLESGRVGLLHAADHLVPLYAQQGWVEARFEHLCLEFPATEPAGSDGGQVTARLADFGNAQDVEAMMGVYAAAAGQTDGAFVRDHPDYWSKWVAYQCERKGASAVLVVGHDARAVGYAIGGWTQHEGRDTLNLLELFVRPGALVQGGGDTERAVVRFFLQRLGRAVEGTALRVSVPRALVAGAPELFLGPGTQQGRVVSSPLQRGWMVLARDKPVPLRAVLVMDSF